MRLRLAIVVTLLLATGCASGRPNPADRMGHGPWKAGLAELDLAQADVVYPFETTPEMEAWARRVTLTANTPVERLLWLQRALFDRRFEFAYEEDVTLTAAEAFTNRSGNCLAFTSLFIALARSVDIPAFLVSVERILEVSREESLVVVNRHVMAGYSEAARMHLFDFYLTTDVPHQHHKVADDLEASGMYHTNIGARLLQQERVAEAEAQLSLAVRLAPELSAAWVNLGVARRRLGDRDGAFRAYEQALEVDAGNTSALTNLAYLYREMGRAEEARLALLAAARGRTTPFTLIALADAEMAVGKLDEAAKYLRKARRQYRATPEVYEAMSRLARRNDQPERADRLAARAEALRTRNQ